MLFLNFQEVCVAAETHVSGFQSGYKLGCIEKQVHMNVYQCFSYYCLNLRGRYITDASQKKAALILLWFRFVDDVLFVINIGFSDYVERIYLVELEIIDTIDILSNLPYSCT